MVIHANVGAIASGGLFAGEDTSDPNASGVEVFQDSKNHPAAVASIILFAANRAGFKPKQDGVIADQNIYNNFVTRISTFPGFTLQTSSEVGLQLSRGKDSLKESIAAGVDAGVGESGDVADAFMKELPSTLGDKSEEGWLLTLTVIQVRNESVYVGIYSLSLILSQNKDGGVEIGSQTIHLRQTGYRLITTFLTAQAKALVRNINTVQVATFIDELTTGPPA
ncbi:hypothetical protein BC939DRAFT_502063 [Gamsiella multidivaricata]|uniref:uncharacterized protein n=1 Tax=Gamsiella multidivaricata TaxID=101098 RepID=UPI002220FAEE|nr:uncharacterized protein BC939DRAFT_502063 [Gamsiella multidivaricata]KAG0359438.1 hypothetical protein BGZ54_009963 [Gamsiella multidivaricata]KAI7825608.1 hypothetical protein BC939DRAFT_502063 [Gamsiella multidivaricata]